MKAPAWVARLVALLAAHAQATTNDVDWGPLFSASETLAGERRLRALGPIVEIRLDGSGRSFAACRPVFSRTSDPVLDRVLDEYVWPAGMVRTLGHDTFWRVLFLYGNEFDRRDERARFRACAFPFLWVGRDAHGERYAGLFPMAGDVREVLGLDRARFLLFPCYARTEKDDLRTDNVLWPVFSRTVGPGVSRFRVFPLYGRSERAGQWVKQFVLWPVWTSVRGVGGKEEDGGYILFPVYGRARTADQESQWFLPPLFRWCRSKGETRVTCPWPFVKYTAGERESRIHLWPLWGRDVRDACRSSFLLWPLISTSESVRGGARVRRTYVAPVFSAKTTFAASRADGSPSDGLAPNASDGDTVIARNVRIWPLASYQREKDVSRFRMPDLWPMDRAASVERNFAPLWTLYSRERHGTASEDEVLWGLFRSRRESGGARSLSLFPLFSVSSSPEDGGRADLSLLLGAVRVRREGLRGHCRLLYFLRFGAADERQTTDPNAE